MEQIQALIHARKIAPGKRLPSERELKAALAAPRNGERVGV